MQGTQDSDAETIEGDTGSNSDASVGSTEILYPDEARFVEVVLPVLVSECGAGCHQNPVLLDNNDIPNGNQFEFDPDNISDSVTEILHPNYASPNDPASSEIITHHIGNAYGEIRDPVKRRAIEDWLADTLIPKGMGTTSTGSSDVSCAHLPTGDGIGPPGWFEEFADVINPMFVGTLELPEGFCSGAGCHTIVGAGGALNFLPATDSCSTQWNFFVSQSFLNLTELSASPLLRQPLGEPGIHTHGGRQVFNGQDENYILLRNWITDLAVP